MTHPAPITAARQACDLCGEDGELRSMNRSGFQPDDVFCRECFPTFHDENDFTDYQLVQEANP